VDGNMRNQLRLIVARPPLLQPVSEIRASITKRLEPFVSEADDSHSPKSYCIPHLLVPSRKQVGPTCGLTALLMAHDYFREDAADESLAAELLVDAKANGFTAQGEMFNAYNLARFAQQKTGLEAKVEEWSGLEQLVSHIVQNRIVLVPYDSDSNHEPTLMGGRKAHWALIKGSILSFMVISLSLVLPSLLC
jgi:hypothetical protein